ncbi:G-protein coupled receptor Mth-like [Ruditapes philippinarum]|uniref:G-protein coupled receptor Mth-like n=1 Tax=Ruditapes philippinarum TaxID=129788 RepID=UPI00295B23ED|nr:G-protein coupled receptor Mth-like [Ruditapes philippinarum]
MEIKSLRNQFCYIKIFTFVLSLTGLPKGPEATKITTNSFPTQSSVTATTTTDNQDYYNDPEEMLKTDSEYCKTKSSCFNKTFPSFPDKSCYCDKLCGLLQDCCKNFYPETEAETTLKMNQFSCVLQEGILKNENYGVHMVTKCSEHWNHKETETLCEENTDADDIFLKLPVSYQSIMYKNLYCAQCNYKYEFEYWKPEMKCLNKTGVRSLPGRPDCELFYLPPKPEIGYRTCQLKPRVIDSCSDKNAEHFNENEEKCTNGSFSIVYDSSGIAFRNEHCASCNGQTGTLFCEIITPSSPFNNTPTETPRKVYSFRLLVDFNKGTVDKNGVISDMGNCADNELYDSFSEKCREIFCPPPLVAVKGSCSVNETNETNETISSTGNCTMVKLDPSEYIIINNSRLFVLSNNKTYLKEEFRLIENNVFICVTKTDQNCSHNCDNENSIFQFDIIESYLSMIGLIISIASLAITLIVYATFSQLMNIPGKILVCLIVALFLAQLLFLVSAEMETVSQLCISAAILIHYFFLAAFCWMNVMALDLLLTFSNTFMSGGSRRNKSRFIKYSLYAWLTPLGVVTSAVILDFCIDIEDISFKPQYGKNVCWISSKYGLIIFFAAPLAALKLFDVVAFAFTAFNIARANKQGAMASKRSRSCSLLINIKLSVIMGLTWIFAFIANITNETVTWYLFIIFNSLQGLLIAVCFLCTRKVGRLLYDKYEQISSKSTSGTQLSSLS